MDVITCPASTYSLDPTHWHKQLVLITQSASNARDSQPEKLRLGALQDLENQLPLPEKSQNRIIRHARHTFGNVYRRLFSLVFLFNMIGLGVLFGRYKHGLSNPTLLSHLATAASANILVAILARQDYIVNLLFRATWLIPLSAPLRLRRILAKVYEYGGVHSGAAFSSVIWFIILTCFLTKDFASNYHNPAIITITYILLIVLFTLCVNALPAFRFSSHNTFENIHRWGGYFSLALFWVEIIVFSHTLSRHSNSTTALTLFQLPATYFLLLTTLHCIIPWLRLHKLHTTPEILSPHAVRLHFQEPIPSFVGIRISDSPLTEWHSFACIPARDPATGAVKTGGSVIISNAGDWTKKTIENPRTWYWIKGVPVTGVMCMARIFRSIVVVTTGSGIGPVLAVVQDLNPNPNITTKIRIIWSTPSPMVTYGEGILKAVKEVDGKAVIIDTRSEGRPDLLKRAWEVYCSERAEAVFVISNPKLTRKVVYGLESRDVPAFGPVWDS